MKQISVAHKLLFKVQDNWFQDKDKVEFKMSALSDKNEKSICTILSVYVQAKFQFACFWTQVQFVQSKNHCQIVFLATFADASVEPEKSVKI